MEGPSIGAVMDLEQKAATIADPSIDMRTRVVTAGELREAVDSVRDADAARVFPSLVPTLLELMRTTEVALHKGPAPAGAEPTSVSNSAEYTFRRILMETIHRVCLHNWNASASLESSRQMLPLLLSGMFDVLRRDNEENGVTACRAIQDIVRTYRIFTDEIVREFLDIFSQQLAHLPQMVNDTLMTPPDPRALPPAMRSFRVLSEMGIVIVTFAQSIGQMQSTPRYSGLMPLLQGIVPRMFEATCLEAPAQHAARSEFEAMGGFWSGMAPSIRNAAAYTDYITAQIKMVSYLAYIMRTHSEYAEKYLEGLELAALRILQDIPATALSPRRDHMVVLRHLLTLPQRKAILPHIDKLLDENVLLGRNASTRETLRATAYAAIADLVHHVRNELTMQQLAHGIHVFSRLFHNPALSNGVHTLAGKMLFGLVDTVVTKESRDEAVRIVTLLLEVSVDRLEAAVAILPEVLERIDLGKKGEEDNTLVHVVEAARPIAPAVYATEQPQEVLGDIRLLIRTLVHGFRVCFSALKKVENTVVDGTLVARLFDGFITALTFYEPETRESQELMEWLAQAFYDMDAHVVQQVWTRRMDFFFECARKRPGLVHLPQLLYGKEHISPTLVAVVLDYLVNHLSQLGEYDDTTAVMTIKLFKLTFSSMIALPALNEPVLAHYLSRLILDSFSCAARSNKPVNYYHLLRALFRAVGGGQGRFELLYGRIHPLLPEILENLNAQLMITDGFARDLVVELCLTVPLRLTHLVPQLQYLMKPLALSLKGPTDLINQGLRTLELFIDNLTPGCLDPTLNTVLRELTDALHGLLRPLPANHQHSHTALRILGKLGGRNRRLLDLEPEMDFRHYAAPAAVLVSMGRDLESIDLTQPSVLAARSLKKGGAGSHIPHAYAFLENTASLLIADGARGRNREEVLERALEGIFDALRIESLKEQASNFIKQVSSNLLALELRRLGSQAADLRTPHHTSPVFTCFINAVGYGLTLDRGSETNESAALVAGVIADFVVSAHAAGADTVATFRLLSRRLCALAVEDGWARKRACVIGIQILLDTPNTEPQWLDEREAEIARTLFHILKDMSGESESNIELVTSLLMRIVRLAVRPLPAGVPLPDRSKPAQVISILIAELSAGSSVVRKTAEEAINLVGALIGRKVSEMLRPMRDRMLANVYTKPLRALPFNMQIGMIDAMRYVAALDPPLPEVNDELLRLLHEVLALADAEDQTLMGRGNNARQSSREIMRLRIACIRLLSASLPLTDYFSKQPSTRQKLTAVYFKSLYSPSPEVKEAAHDGLKVLLAHQSRLPKELLQTGLRPILMNLADPKRLSVAGLEGLARLLELLTNYFKVEIGHKLLDHYRVVADPQLLSTAALTPVHAMEPINKLVSLTNIFHLLPPTANMFLEPLTNAIVQTEAQMHFSAESPFSKPLAKFLERYPIDAADFLMRNLHLPRHVRTYRSIIQARLAPALAREIATRTPYLVDYCLRSGNAALLTPALQIFDDLSDIDPNWLLDYPLVVDALLDVWRQVLPPFGQSSSAGTISTAVLNHKLILALFAKVMRMRPRVDLPFEMITVFTRNYPMDLIRPTRLLYELVAFSDDVAYQRSVFYRFLAGLEQGVWGIEHKTAILRLIITPMIVYRARSASRDALLDSGLVTQIHKLILVPMMQENPLVDGDYLLHIELLHFTTVLVQNYGPQLDEARRDIIKCTWNFITSEDAMVRQVAYLLAANFFAAYDTPEKFILRAWTGLLKPPHYESRTLVRRALSILTPSLLRCTTAEDGYPVWAKTTRRLLAEESHGQSQLIIVYQVVVQQADLFYPVRALFVPHMVNSLHKLGMHGSASTETRHLSIELMQTIFDWEQRAVEQKPELEKKLVELKVELARKGGELEVSERKVKEEEVKAAERELALFWRTPLPYRENVVSYLVRLTTAQHDSASRNTIIGRALALLKQIVGPNGWKDVTVKLHFFGRMLEQADLSALSPDNLAAALLFAKVLQVVTADKPDSWYQEPENAIVLSKLVRKGLLTDDVTFHDALHPIFDRLVQLFPLPKEDEEQHPLMIDFHQWINTSLSDGLQNATNVRSVLLMLQSVIAVTPERVEGFGSALFKLLGKLSKDHCSVQPPLTASFEQSVKLLISALDICLAGAIHLPADNRRFLTSALTMLVEKSKSPTMCKYLLALGRTWAFQKNEPYPPTKDKATFLQRMATLETRGEAFFNAYLELVYDIYIDPSLRRSDLTVKLEQSFLLGCRARDIALREKFVDLLDASVPRALASRLVYIIGVQSWEPLADHYWIPIALHLLLSAVDVDAVQLASRKPSPIMPTGAGLPPRRVSEIIQPLKRMLIIDPNVAHDVWMSAFPAAWKSLSRRDQVDVTHHLISLFSREYHARQAEKRPNVIQTLLTSVNLCTPALVLPPHLIKFLAKTFGAWHAGMEILQTMNLVLEEDPSIRDTIPDSLAELYAELAEEDLFYGLWRRRSLHNDTNIAVSFEENGMWTQAAAMYEAAQQKTRTGTLPYAESEYIFWEDHWILAQEKLQQWDILYDYARNDNNPELLLESAWRTKNWSQDWETIQEQVETLPTYGTLRRRVFESFLALVKPTSLQEKNVEFMRVLEDGMQLALRKWVALPAYMSAAHIPLLHHFQQFVELQEAVQIFGSLAVTNESNLEKKSSELKLVLQAWRERLPNMHDDIDIWSDLVAWRKNVFQAINKAYMPFVDPSNTGGHGSNSGNNSGYRGYHETAWIINRFAHVTRKHQLYDVCQTLLVQIYQLPNIEISEAFLKLREQARCHLRSAPNDLQPGLDVINSTNLMYFSMPQKAEFSTLKGIFNAAIGNHQEANDNFSAALGLESNLPKTWQEWAKFNDNMFSETNDVQYAAQAVACYLQAAGMFKSGKTRMLLSRVLWLLGVEDPSGAVLKSFDTYKGEAAYWYWISLIPQLCTSISNREVRQARFILLNIAKLYPQALFFHLRTTRDEMTQARRNAMVMEQRVRAAEQQQQQRNGGDVVMQDAATNGNTPHPNVDPQLLREAQSAKNQQRPGSEHIDEVVQILKTAFPLLILSMESMVEQLNSRFKASQDENTYRFISMLLQEALQSYAIKVNQTPDEPGIRPETLVTMQRVLHDIPVVYRADFEADFLDKKKPPTLNEYIRRLQSWRDRYEKVLDARPRVQSLEMLSHYLTEFQYSKFDDIEIPGQYTEDKDGNQNFVRIARFGHQFENCRVQGQSWKRFTMIGQDSSVVSWVVQLPAHRYSRREERLMQVMRMFNQLLRIKKEARKRNLHFHIPAAVSCSPALRLYQQDSSYVSLGEICDQFCEESGVAREDPILIPGEKVKTILKEFTDEHKRMPDKLEYFNLKKDLLEEVMKYMIPDNVLSKYMARTMTNPADLWLSRKQFAKHLAGTMFTTYLFCLTNRLPFRFLISRRTGQVFMSEMLPGYSPHAPVFQSNDIVPFRYTPNMQQFAGAIHQEGTIPTILYQLGRCLSLPEFDLEKQLSLYGRDEVATWFLTRGHTYTVDMPFRQHVATMIDNVVKRANTMGCKLERDQAIETPGSPAPANVTLVYTVTKLISAATDPMNLMKMTEIYHPWF